MKARQSLLLAFALFVVCGCSYSKTTVIREASNRIPCSSDQIQMTALRTTSKDKVADIYETTGCGRTIYISCGGAGWANPQGANSDCTECTPEWEANGEIKYCSLMLY